jgi:hypothetical protein
MTESDDPRPDLSEPQLTAIELLVAGRNLAAVAKTLDMARQTVSVWYNKDPEFRAALNLRRQELRAELHDQLRALVPVATETLEQELRGPNRLPAAVHVLKASGLYGVSRPDGPTDPQEIRSKEAQDALLRSLSPF